MLDNEPPAHIKYRPMKESDVMKVRELLNNYLSKFSVKQIFSKKEIAHFFLPRKNVIYSYCIENQEGKVTDFISFYSLPSSVLNNPKYDKLEAAYSYYFVRNEHTIKDL